MYFERKEYLDKLISAEGKGMMSLYEFLLGNGEALRK